MFELPAFIIHVYVRVNATWSWVETVE